MFFEILCKTQAYAAEKARNYLDKPAVHETMVKVLLSVPLKLSFNINLEYGIPWAGFFSIYQFLLTKHLELKFWVFNAEILTCVRKERDTFGHCTFFHFDFLAIADKSAMVVSNDTMPGYSTNIMHYHVQICRVSGYKFWKFKFINNSFMHIGFRIFIRRI